MKVKILLNPYANRWRARSKGPEIESVCRTAGLDYDLSIIPAPGGAEEAAKSALSEGFDVVVAAGGDGTVSEVVNGLITVAGDGPTAPLGIMPLGTGNDFNDMSFLPRDLTAAAQTIAKGHTILVDAGQVTVDGETRYFDNNCALAMEPMVTLEHIRMKRTSGNIRYVLALFKALIKLKAWQMEITWDHGSYDGPAYLLSICNSSRTGGLFPIAPGARMDDGLLDVVLAPEVSKARVLVLITRLFRGTHIFDPQVTHVQTSTLDVKCVPPTPVHADGEIIAETAGHIEYQIIPDKITLLAHRS